MVGIYFDSNRFSQNRLIKHDFPEDFAPHVVMLTLTSRRFFFFITFTAAAVVAYWSSLSFLLLLLILLLLLNVSCECIAEVPPEGMLLILP